MLKIHNTSAQARALATSIINSGITCAWDLDGVLLDARHRQLTLSDGSLDLIAYRANSTAEKIAQDKTLALIEAIQILNIAKVPYHVITARVACANTLALLAKHNINPVSVMARQGEEDQRKDHDLKTYHLLNNFSQRQRENMLLIDDNLNNCQAVKQIGLKAINVLYTGH